MHNYTLRNKGGFPRCHLSLFSLRHYVGVISITGEPVLHFRISSLVPRQTRDDSGPTPHKMRDLNQRLYLGTSIAVLADLSRRRFPGIMPKWKKGTNCRNCARK